MNSQEHKVGIECRKCGKQWKIRIPLTGNAVEVIATMCECGAIIVGNYNSKLIEKEKNQTSVTGDSISKDEKYLTNGHFDFLELSEEDLKRLPELALE